MRNEFRNAIKKIDLENLMSKIFYFFIYFCISFFSFFFLFFLFFLSLFSFFFFIYIFFVDITMKDMEQRFEENMNVSKRNNLSAWLSKNRLKELEEMKKAT
jgi:hypothetical protein